MTIFWAVLITALICLGLAGLFMGNSTPDKSVEVKVEDREETYSEKLVRVRKEAAQAERLKFLGTIREPVFSFLKTFEQNPKRFRLKCLSEGKGATEIIIGAESVDFGNVKDYSLTDLLTGEEFKFTYHRTRLYKGQVPVNMKSHEWLERNELSHIHEEIRKHYNLRDMKLQFLLKTRRERVLQVERDRLTKIYGGLNGADNNQA